MTTVLGDAANTGIELSTIGQTSIPADSEASRRDEAVGLHPVDGGLHAWLFVFSAFVLECLVWGFPFRYVLSWNIAVLDQLDEAG